jgi:hypothetical protein
MVSRARRTAVQTTRSRLVFVSRHLFALAVAQLVDFSGARRDRTADLRTASAALSQLSYDPEIRGPGLIHQTRPRFNGILDVSRAAGFWTGHSLRSQAST